MNNLKFIIIISIYLSALSAFCQVNNNENFSYFYVVDTIKIDNPVVFYKTNQSGMFVKSLKTIKEIKRNIKKIVRNDETYIYGEDLYRFFDDVKKIEMYKYPDYGNCEFETESIEGKNGIVFKKFKIKPKRFILALINASFYDNQIKIYGKKKSVFNNYDKSLYYKIVFPLCE